MYILIYINVELSVMMEVCRDWLPCESTTRPFLYATESLGLQIKGNEGKLRVNIRQGCLRSGVQSVFYRNTGLIEAEFGDSNTCHCHREKLNLDWMISQLNRDQQGIYNKTIYTHFGIWQWQFFLCWKQTITDVYLWPSRKFSNADSFHIYPVADVIFPSCVAVYNTKYYYSCHIFLSWWKI